MDVLAPPDLANVLRFLAWPLVLGVVLVSLVLAAVVRWRYVATVIRLQGASLTAADQNFGSSQPAARPVPALRLVFDELDDRLRWPAALAVVRMRRLVLAVQVACDLAFWCLFLYLVMFGVGLISALRYAASTGDGTLPASVVRIAITAPFEGRDSWVDPLFLVLYLVGPAAVLCAGQTAMRKRYVYLPVVAAAGALVYATAETAAWPQTVPFVAVLGTFAIIVSALQHPRLRGAAVPLMVALPLSIAPWTAALLIFAVRGVDTNAPWSSLAELAALLAWLLLMAATFVGILLILARRYETKRFSDIEAGRVAFWLLAAFAALGFGAATTPGGLTNLALQLAALLACWVLWRSVGGGAVRRIVRHAPPRVGSLLVLRVFKRPASSEVFIDRLLSCWRFAAPVYLIAGADLAGASIEPDEFFAFIRRRVGSRFIHGTAHIRHRIRLLDDGRDPDGRYRVNELFCVEGVWRPTVETLIAKAGSVLLDLREYHPRRAGTRYEMYQLMNSVPPDRVLVLVGRNDDAEAISSQLQQAWEAMSDASPNRRLDNPELRVCRLRSGSAAEVMALFSRIHSMAAHAPAAPDRETSPSLGGR